MGAGRCRVATITLSLVFCSFSASCLAHRSAPDQSALAASVSSSRLLDGNEWTLENLHVNTAQSYCYDNAEANCRRYGRLYTWAAAQRGCRSLGTRWRLPTDDEWRRLAKRYGGIDDESADSGTVAYRALLTGGSSGFNAVLGGGRDQHQYARMDAHGFYWTASENDSANAVFYNFAHGGLALHRQDQGEKWRAFSVRCVRTAQEVATLRLSNAVTLDLVVLPGLPALWVGRTPVTMAQFRAFVDEAHYQTDAENPAGNGPGRIGGHGWNADHKRFEGWFPQYTWRYTGWPLTGQHPASNISWNDARKFCEWLAAKSGRAVRLPTVQEWERATRAGTTTAYFSGDDPASLNGYANVGDRSLRRATADPDSASGGFSFDDGFPFTSPVGSFKPNPWALYDMVGNVFQWCAGRGGPKVCGCSYNDDPAMCRENGELRSVQPYSRYAYFGFRVVVVPAGSR